MSTIRVDNFGPSAGGTTYSARGIAKAWVNFDSSATISARDSLNMSSLTDNGTGDYTINFSNNFGAADYSITASTYFPTGQFNFLTNNNGSYLAASSARVETVTHTGSLAASDNRTNAIAIHGDLA